MIIIGSYVLALLGYREFDSVNDLDLVGVEADIDRFRQAHGDIIESERSLHNHRHTFFLKPGQPIKCVEIDYEQSESDRMLPDLCPASAQVMGFECGVPTVEVLYALKRSHLNMPVHFDKGVRDMLALKPLIKPYSEAEEAFYRARKKEIWERFNLHRQRFSLSIRNEDFFDNSDHMRFYVHDDLHEVVAHTPGKPLYKQCKRDLSLAKIDTDLFEQLSHEDRLRMVQEEFMVIGLERHFMHDRSLAAPKVYEMGMFKTIRDLFVGYFQDFCIDHLDELLAPPPFDFVERFVAAERDGRLRQVEFEIPPPGEEHKRVWAEIQNGNIELARGLCEDLIRKAERGIDTHAYFLLGVAMLRGKKLDLAERHLRHCLSRDRKNPLAWFHLGITLRLAGKQGEAIKALNHSGRLGLRQFGLDWNLGLAYESQNMTEQAIAAYRRALAIGPDDPRPRQRLEALGVPA